VEPLHGKLVTLVPVTAEHVLDLRRIRDTPSVGDRWGDYDAEWPFDDPDLVCLTILVDDTVRGLVQYGEEDDPDYRHAAIDIFVDPEVHGRGIGQDTVRTVARYLLHDVGHHRLVIDPAADNEAAIRCYEAVGFRRVGVLRRYWHGPDGRWHDGLLLDLLADELDSS
jgi:RimJ/RimL family protein N-acetyltransferase